MTISAHLYLQGNPKIWVFILSPHEIKAGEGKADVRNDSSLYHILPWEYFVLHYFDVYFLVFKQQNCKLSFPRGLSKLYYKYL